MQSVVYTRVSREEQVEGWSPDAQREQCLKLAQTRGWEVSQVYKGPGRSAKTDARPAFQRMMKHAEAGWFELIIVHKLDRFSRNLTDVSRTSPDSRRRRWGWCRCPSPGWTRPPPRAR